jgi:hypothetical protein
MYSSWNLFLWLLWQCRWHSCRFVSVKTLARARAHTHTHTQTHKHKHTYRTVQPSGWIASMHDITVYLKDRMPGGESIRTGWGTPASGLKLHNDSVSAYYYYKMLQICVPRSRTKVHINSLKHHHAVQLEMPRITAMQLSHIWTVKESPQMLQVHAGWHCVGGCSTVV